MSTYLTSYPAAPFDEENPQPGNVIYSRAYDDGVEVRLLYLSAEDMSVDYPTDARVIGHWDNDGVLTGNVNADYEIIRPFGNDKGAATDSLDYHHFQGHGQRYTQEAPAVDTMAEYPAVNQPFMLTMDRYWDETPGWEGWGWKATIMFADPNRAPNARAIGIYDEDWNYLYTTGAFVWTLIGKDEEGEDVYKWQTHTPAGRATPTKEPVYYALLLGSAQEGRYVLPEDNDQVVANFWESDQ